MVRFTVNVKRRVARWADYGKGHQLPPSWVFTGHDVVVLLNDRLFLTFLECRPRPDASVTPQSSPEVRQNLKEEP